MKQRGRPSSLAVVPRAVTELIERLPPPHSLTDEQAEVWSAIVSGHPADWFAAGSVPVLIQLCRHTVICKRLAELIDMGNEQDWFELIKEQRQESAIVTRLTTSLRLTPQSLIDHTSGNKKQAPAVNRPWAFANTG
jgi:hypothetical protein